MTYATNTRSIPATIGSQLSNLRTALTDRWTRYNTFRTTRNELDALTDRELHDLGISRSNIHEIATYAAYGQD